MSKPAAKQPDPTITPGEMRIELQLEGLRSVVSGGFLSMAQAASRQEAANARQEALLERILEAIETQTKLLTRANGHARHDDAHVNE